MQKGKNISYQVLAKKNEVKHVSSYKYLRIQFTSIDSFFLCEGDLYKRALEANFKRSRNFDDFNANVNTYLFDHTVNPIVMYGSEIWRTVNTSSRSLHENSFDIVHYLRNIQSERRHIKT